MMKRNKILGITLIMLPILIVFTLIGFTTSFIEAAVIFGILILFFVCLFSLITGVDLLIEGKD